MPRRPLPAREPRKRPHEMTTRAEINDYAAKNKITVPQGLTVAQARAHIERERARRRCVLPDGQ